MLPRPPCSLIRAFDFADSSWLATSNLTSTLLLRAFTKSTISFSA